MIAQGCNRRTLALGLGAWLAGVGAARRVQAGEVGSPGRFQPIDLFADTRIFLRAQINGVEVSALLDTGAEMTVVDTRLASRLGLAAKGSGSAIGTGGSASVSFADGVTIQAAGLRLTDRTVAIIDLGAVAEAMGHPLPLLLGKDLLGGLVMDLDLPNRQIAFFPPSHAPKLAGATVLPFTQVGPLRAIPLRAASAEAALFHVDTGSGGALDLYPAFSRKLGLPGDRAASTTLAGGVGGLAESPILSLDQIAVGVATLHEVPAILSSAGAAATTEPVAGAIGMAVLSRFRLLADFQGDRLTLVGAPEALAKPFWKNTLGLALMRTGDGVAISHVMPNSPAAQTALAKGASIVSINGARAGTLTTPALRSLMGSPVGADVVVATATHGEVRLRARVFY